jgi:hypothetical protein
LISSVIVIMVTVSMVLVGFSSAPKAYATTYELLRGTDHSLHGQWQIAEGLRQIGIQHGDKVGIIGQGTPGFRAYWARLARVKIVAEIIFQDVTEFTETHPEVRAKASEAFARTGARILIADNLPSHLVKEGWQRIGKTDQFAYLLPRVS